MLKVVRKQCLLFRATTNWIFSSLSCSARRCLWLVLAGILLIITLSIIGAIDGAGEGFPTAHATSQYRNASSDCTDAQQKSAFGSAVVVNSGEVICDNLTSFGGPVVVRGEVIGDVLAFGGDVVIGGKVNGNVTLYMGNITLQDSAQVNGDIHLCGGNWIHGDDSRLKGSVVDCTRGVGQILYGKGDPILRFWFLVTWIALGILLTFLLPEHVMLVRTTAVNKAARSFVLGLRSVILAPIVLAVLVALIIPIPLAIIVAIGLVAAWALGTVAVGWLLGDYIIRKVKVTPHHNTRLIQVVVGLTALVLAGSLPYIGWLIGIGAGLLGLGAVFLSRFGTRLYGQPKNPLSL